MRRSAAPSQKGFVTPFAKSKPVEKPTPPVEESFQEQKENTSPVVEKTKFIPKSTPKSFVSPLKSGASSVAAVKKATTTPTATDNDLGSYWKALYTKKSNKKHKVFEDGILCIKDRTVSLKDMEGKQMSKTAQYSAATLSSLITGSTLGIGNFEVEVTEPIAAEFYLSGKMFLKESIAGESPAPTVPTMTPKKFKSHFADSTELPPLIPLYSSETPGSLVLYKAEGTTDEARVVDVVVDPKLSCLLRPHQREGVKFMFECVSGLKNGPDMEGCILADEMGLGKTLQVLTLVWTMLKQGPYGVPCINPKKREKVIIVTPVSLVDNWRKEVQKWLGMQRLQPLTIGDVTAKETVEIIETFKRSATEVHPVLIVPYEKFRKHSELLASINCGLLVCDEGHRLKNSNIQTTKSLDMLPTKKRILLTGTPIQNDLDEFYAMCDFCNKAVLSDDLTQFKRHFASVIERSREATASRIEKEQGEATSRTIAELTAKFIIRRTASILTSYLPPKIEQVIMCRMTELQERIYTSFLKHCGVLYGSISDPLPAITILRKLCNHPSFIIDTMKEMKMDVPEDLTVENSGTEYSGKLHVLDGILRTTFTDFTGDRIVIISNSTKSLDMISRLCDRQKWRYLRLDGSTPNHSRQKLVDQFNSKDGGHDVFLLSTKAGGVGLNLIGANRLVLYDSDWNPAHDRQAMARVWRDGQTKTVYIYRLLSTGTIEEKIFQRQIAKTGLSNNIVDGKASEKKNSFSKEELKDIFSYSQETCSDTHDLLDCDRGRIVKRNAYQVKTGKSLATEFAAWTHSGDSSTYVDPVLCKVVEEGNDRITFVFSHQNEKGDEENGIDEEEMEQEEEEEEGEEEREEEEIEEPMPKRTRRNRITDDDE
ncbi:hypothetical protein PROFUN_05532 [Planoprotostelium fungivorum]|uniref:DNA repair and recombination protein RAD54B n=1 Tax=Planoprotostelium fungivorum TaxID=1890364 RepID=A0A2P6NR07_9EUKA|nr:hypothetical protein PROFUN_05532 [Planoprotostelium fungivorum]